MYIREETIDCHYYPSHVPFSGGARFGYHMYYSVKMVDCVHNCTNDFSIITISFNELIDEQLV